MIGLIEGIAESTASILKVFSGWLSDRMGNRKWLMAIGYGISTLSRPLVAVATGWRLVLGSRFVDRFGKGVRTAPRDAIIAESTDHSSLGKAFGFHRAMDTMGAVAGRDLLFWRSHRRSVCGVVHGFHPCDQERFGWRRRNGDTTIGRGIGGGGGEVRTRYFGLRSGQTGASGFGFHRDLVGRREALAPCQGTAKQGC